MSIELSQLGPDGEQQLGINPGSSDEGQQMRINPCPLNLPTHQTEDNNWASTQVHRMEDNKWELTHVHTRWRMTNENQPMSTKFILLEVCNHKTVGKRWDKTYKTYWCWAHIITKGCSHNMVDNKWESAHVY
jgi:hypothetical protein